MSMSNVEKNVELVDRWFNENSELLNKFQISRKIEKLRDYDDDHDLLLIKSDDSRVVTHQYCSISKKEYLELEENLNLFKRQLEIVDALSEEGLKCVPVTYMNGMISVFKPSDDSRFIWIRLGSKFRDGEISVRFRDTYVRSTLEQRNNDVVIDYVKSLQVLI